MKYCRGMDETTGDEIFLDKYHPMITRRDEATGEITRVERSHVHGLDEFAASWPTDTELPEPMIFAGWQMSDEEHPAGEGRRGYRIVFKTIRTVADPALTIEGPNFRIKISNGAVTWGEPRYTTAIPARRSGEWLVPEWGTLSETGAESIYEPQEPPTISMEAHQETTPDCNHVELLLILDGELTADYGEQLTLGRARVAPMTAALDLLCGERIIGPVMTEEIGTIFDDWHWNRSLGGRAVFWERQARLKRLDTAGLVDAFLPYLKRHKEKSSEELNRVRVASQWYWTSEREADPVLKFIGYWLSLEALELSQNSNIAPIKRVTAEVLNVDRAVIAEQIGRVYGHRNRVLHGESRSVEPEVLQAARALTMVLLERHLLGAPTPDSIEDLRAAFGLEGASAAPSCETPEDSRVGEG